MDRRKSIKTLIIGGVSTGVIAEACKNTDNKETGSAQANANAQPTFDYNRMPEELEYYNKVKDLKFFNEAEIGTITILGDIIIPKDAVSGSASDAKVPEFIEYIVNDMPDLQLPMRGGLRWLDVQCLKKFDKAFKDCNHDQQMEMVELIAWPDRVKNKPELAPGVAFFNLMRNLTASGFYTTQMGGKDVGYIGNTPNQWNGVPDDVLAHYKLAYSERELKECAHYP
ncbi:MAG TPA: gluconate 2-dehydrogenase subunit 3 family protein [Puia sp.]|nr:gluconate 2-dehydrogenase subunit 3 family protein [Puia sp.]